MSVSPTPFVFLRLAHEERAPKHHAAAFKIEGISSDASFGEELIQKDGTSDLARIPVNAPYAISKTRDLSIENVEENLAAGLAMQTDFYAEMQQEYDALAQRVKKRKEALKALEMKSGDGNDDDANDDANGDANDDADGDANGDANDDADGDLKDDFIPSESFTGHKSGYVFRNLPVKSGYYKQGSFSLSLGEREAQARAEAALDANKYMRRYCVVEVIYGDCVVPAIRVLGDFSSQKEAEECQKDAAERGDAVNARVVASNVWYETAFFAALDDACLIEAAQGRKSL